MKLAIRLALVLLVGSVCAEARAQILISNFAPAYTQNFDTLASSPENGTSTFLPPGWAFSETGTNANTSYGIDEGGDNTGNTYSYGAVGSTERALGELTSGSLQSRFGAQFQNNGTNAITSLTISYIGEQWRRGNRDGDRLDFQISTNATSLTTGTWTDINTLDFVAPTTSPNNSALNGNLAANQVAFSNVKFALPSAINPNATFWIRWISTDISNNDSGLAVDNFSLSAVPEPSTYVAAAAALLGLVYFVRRRRHRLAAAVVKS